ncbi:phosphoethanolamine transferase [Providencia vermicola]|uniref:phosphoethanolamine transferase n=1 Tax=Providencia TaxID=586 RepID=UPI00234B3A1A|nr:MULTISPECIES: phosphoethanolamine transferase [Providencia]ELR5143482.1 phosphoethanolamine transferase [Providencia stuartii]WER20759.1 phosphoethanolamine transferase [Providencia stuartii]WER24878.1 phosphoethanolamine transferase [Providencia stuartii]WER28969.1 phosphoethanolamine transferase [Providencia stuartii]
MKHPRLSEWYKNKLQDKIVKIKNLLIYIIPLIILIISSKLMLKGSGYAHPTLRDITLVCALYIILYASKKAYVWIGIPIAILYAIYTPIGLTFDKPTYQYFASVIATDAIEGIEFFTQISIVNYFYAILIIIGILAFKKLCSKLNINYYRNKTLMIVLVIIALINQSPFEYFYNVYESATKVKEEIITLRDFTKSSEWGKSTLDNNQHYDDYVLIIGESVRRDYMGIYGYPINNTPFLNRVNSTIIDGLNSADNNTIGSLRLMLTLSDKETVKPNYGLNIVGLAKSAGFKTYWISNQGYIGQHDTPITFIAKHADVKRFNKLGAFNSNDESDFSLIPLFKKELTSPTQKKQKRLFIIHLYGSHPNPCGRIEDYDNPFTTKDIKYHNISCYVASINKTDEVIEAIYSLLEKQYKQKDRTFSVIYFADHGLSHQDTEEQIKIMHGKTKYAYRVPLIQLSSDQVSTQYIIAKKSGMMFINGLASWLGISNPHLKESYHLFTPESDEEDFGLSEKLEARMDDAINIQEK